MGSDRVDIAYPAQNPEPAVFLMDLWRSRIQRRHAACRSSPPQALGFWL